MRQVPVGEIEEGMILARDILTDDGNTLLGAGTVLTEKHRRLLERRGIETAGVVDAEAGEAAGDEVVSGVETPPPDETEGMDPKTRERLERLDHMFGPVLDAPLMAELYRRVRARFLRGAEHG